MSLFDNRMSRFRETTSFSSRLGVTTSDSVNRKRVNVLDFWILLQRLDAERAVSRLQQQVPFFFSPFNLFSLFSVHHFCGIRYRFLGGFLFLSLSETGRILRCRRIPPA